MKTRDLKRKSVLSNTGVQISYQFIITYKEFFWTFWGKQLRILMLVYLRKPYLWSPMMLKPSRYSKSYLSITFSIISLRKPMRIVDNYLADFLPFLDRVWTIYNQRHSSSKNLWRTVRSQFSWTIDGTKCTLKQAKHSKVWWITP